MSVPLAVKAGRVLGVLVGAFLVVGSFVPESDAPAEAAAAKFLSPLIIGTGILVCLPYSRLRRRASFWVALGFYSVCLAGLVAVHGWITVHRLPTEGLLNIRTVMLTPIFFLLAVQIPCILRLWRQHELAA
jgi:hypothetical protein